MEISVKEIGVREKQRFGQVEEGYYIDLTCCLIPNRD